jgi:tripeptide aminopeptidase
MNYPEVAGLFAETYTETEVTPQLPGMNKRQEYQWQVRGEGPYVLLSAHLDKVTRFGCDDRCGLAIIGALLAHTDLPCKVLLGWGEERGTEPDWPEGFLNDCLFALVLDRHGDSDILTFGSGREFCQPEFGAWVESCAIELGLPHRVSRAGRWSHAVGLSQHMETVNLSVGFYSEHTDNEYMDSKATVRTARLVGHLIEHRTEAPL